VLNLAALLLKSSEEPPRSKRLEASFRFSPSLLDGSSTPMLRTIEQARANRFLKWYYAKLRERHRAMFNDQRRELQGRECRTESRHSF
jgi:hypothetical protein